MIHLENLELLNHYDFNRKHLSEITNNSDEFSYLEDDFFNSKYKIIIEKESCNNLSLLISCNNEIVFYIKLSRSPKHSYKTKPVMDILTWKTGVIDYYKDLSGFTEHILCSYVLINYILKFPDIYDPLISSDLWYRMLGHLSIANKCFYFAQDNNLVFINDKHFPSYDPGNKKNNFQRSQNLQTFYRENHKLYDYLLISNDEIK